MILAAADPLQRHAEPSGFDYAVLTVARHLRGVFYGMENIEAGYRQAVIDLIDQCNVADSEIVLRAGNPAETIAELAGEQAVDLVVLGSIKRGCLKAALLGSKAVRVVDDAPCDVLVKPPAQ